MNEDLVLECVECDEPTSWDPEEGRNSVRCAECSKRHSRRSLAPAWGIVR